jgi:hypothetical protein
MHRLHSWAQAHKHTYKVQRSETFGKAYVLLKLANLQFEVQLRAQRSSLKKNKVHDTPVLCTKDRGRKYTSTPWPANFSLLITLRSMVQNSNQHEAKPPSVEKNALGSLHSSP